MVHQFQVIAEMRENSNISQDLFSLAMGPSLNVHSYSGCIIGGVRFHLLERDFRRTTQNSGVMVVGEGNGVDANNNFYGVLDEVLHVQYPFEQHARLFKYRWFDTNKNKKPRMHKELGYKSINTSHFLFAEVPVILATQAHQVFYLEDPKNSTNWKIVQVLQNKRVWDVLEVEDTENDQLNVLEIIVVGHRVEEHIIQGTLYARLKLILQLWKDQMYIMSRTTL